MIMILRIQLRNWLWSIDLINQSSNQLRFF